MKLKPIDKGLFWFHCTFLRFYVSEFVIEYFFDLHLRYILLAILALVLIVIVVVEWKENFVFRHLLSEFVKMFLSLAYQVGSRKIAKRQNWCLLFHGSRNQQRSSFFSPRVLKLNCGYIQKRIYPEPITPRCVCYTLGA